MKGHFKTTNRSSFVTQKLIKFIYISLILLNKYSRKVHAQDMVVRLDQSGYAMENLSIKNQGGVPFCFAYSAAQLLDSYINTFDQSAKRKSIQPEKEISAMAAAIDAGYDARLTYLQSLNYGGFVCEAVNSIIKHGACEEQETAKLFQDIKGYSVSEENKSAFVNYYGEIFKGLNYRSPQVEALFSKLNRPVNPKEQMTIFKLVVDKICENKRQNLKKLKLSCVEMKRRSQGENSADHLLQSLRARFQPSNVNGKTQPVAMKYCANFYTKGPEYSAVVGYKDDDKKILWQKDCMIHYSVVMGMKINENGGRDYLIRDSYGKNCGGGKMHPAFRCEGGHVWVSEKVVAQNILQLDFLNSPNLNSTPSFEHIANR
jgi:hypothetical protein